MIAGQQLYPTPEHIIKKMCEGLKLRGQRILEPSAGTGAILKYIRKNTGLDNVTLYAFEIDPLLNLGIGEINYVKNMGFDFLDEPFPYQVDAIVMNPPFADGCKHLLRAWDLLKNGEIRCLLNAETYDNPYSKERELLKHIIDQNGTVEYLGNCFSQSERRTDVNVILVSLTKETEQLESFFKSESFEKAKSFEEGQWSTNDITTIDLLKNKELEFNRAVAAFKKAIEGMQEFQSITGNNLTTHKSNIYLNHLVNGAVNEFVDHLNAESWDKLLRETKFSDYLTTEVRDDFLEKFKQQRNVAFTERNMLQLLDLLHQKRGDVSNQGILSVFDHLTKYHKDNRVYYEGWKSNDAYKVKMKFILPRVVNYEWGFFRTNYRESSILEDMDKAMNTLTGLKLEGMTTANQALQKQADLLKDGLSEDTTCQSTHFNMRFFKKGTVHFTFRDEYVWRMFNYTASCLRGFPLPEPKKQGGKGNKTNIKLLN